MERNKERAQMLDLMQQPAFCVESGVISHINPAAGHLLLTVGQSIAPLLASGQEEYSDFSGCLQLQLRIGGQLLDASVIRYEDADIFLPDTVTVDERFRILSLASMQLRTPLAGLTAVVDQLLPDTDPLQAGQANRRIHQILRILSNMSDVQRFGNRNTCRMEFTEVCSFLGEILEKAVTTLELAQFQIEAQLPDSPIYTLLDREQIERSFYNLLSNALKYHLSDSKILLQLRQNGQRLYLSVTNQSPVAPVHNFYDRFLREPRLEDPSQGLGLGMVLVRCAAANHGGAVLIDQPNPGYTRVTMTLAIEQHRTDMLRSPILRLDYTGERDHCLFELSDVLPTELYRIE